MTFAGCWISHEDPHGLVPWVNETGWLARRRAPGAHPSGLVPLCESDWVASPTLEACQVAHSALRIRICPCSYHHLVTLRAARWEGARGAELADQSHSPSGTRPLGSLSRRKAAGTFVAGSRSVISNGFRSS